jgi:hypothetical protein
MEDYFLKKTGKEKWLMGLSHFFSVKGKKIKFELLKLFAFDSHWTT